MSRKLTGATESVAIESLGVFGAPLERDKTMYRQSVIARIAGARARAIAAALACGLLAGACSSGSGLTPLDGLLGSTPEQTADASASADNGKPIAKSELDRAIEHWGEEYKQRPHDLKAALAYARNLKAAGHKDQAFAIVQNASILHGDSRELASEYGRLALEFDQIGVADKLLAMADDPLKPDWRVISARGTVMAKQGNYAGAVPFYERALAVSPSQASVMNNLAMAHAASGDPAKAEQILRQASATGKDPRSSRTWRSSSGCRASTTNRKSSGPRTCRPILPVPTPTTSSEW
jgi:Flp pilus assembly protein TadD